VTFSSSSPRTVRSASALIVGAELLSGKIRDENLYALSGTLRALGIELRRVVFCPDDQETIAEEIRALSGKFDVVFTSGGVGPTHDDVTIEGIAKALDVPVVVSPELRELLTKVYGEKTNEAHLQMARVPQGSELAEGSDIRWPTIVAKNIWIMPGVPELFRMKLAIIRTHLRGPEPFFSKEIYVSLDETELKDELDHVVAAHPEVEIGSYPKWFDPRYKTRLTFDGRTEEEATLAAADAEERLRPHLVTLT
jgi:molybdenum cofactor synthesis domain-containing protein